MDPIAFPPHFPSSFRSGGNNDAVDAAAGVDSDSPAAAVVTDGARELGIAPVVAAALVTPLLLPSLAVAVAVTPLSLAMALALSIQAGQVGLASGAAVFPVVVVATHGGAYQHVLAQFSRMYV